MVRLTGATVRQALRRPLERELWLEQLFQLGVRSLTITNVTLLFTGMVLAIQTAYSLAAYGGKPFVGDVDLVVGTQALIQDGVRWARLGLAVVERIVDLHEIGFLACKHCFDCREVAVKGRRDADIAAHALRFPVFELREGLAWIAYVMELEQVNIRSLESRQRALELCRVRLLEFGRDEKFVA